MKMTEDRKRMALQTIYSLLSYEYGTTKKKKNPTVIPATMEPHTALTIY